MADIYVAASGDDGSCYKSDTSYPPGGSITAEDSAPIFAPQRTFSTPSYGVTVGLIRFDTSSIPDGATITSASLFLYVNGVNNGDTRNVQGEYYSSANWPVDTSDYTVTPASDAFSVALSTITASQYNEFPLTNPDSNISKTGYTGFRLHISGGAPSGTNNVSFYS